MEPVQEISLTIGQLAGAAGVGVETVRFYERQGLVPKPRRPRSGFRRYSRDAVTRIRFIRRAKELGFTLKEIRGLLELRVSSERSCADVRERATAKLADIDGKMADLARMRSALQELARSCRGDGPTSECPILDAMERDDGRGRD